MKLPEYMTIRYDPNLVKYYCDLDYNMYTKYNVKRVVQDMEYEILQAEIKTGLDCLFKLWKLMSNQFILTTLDVSGYISIGDYIARTRDYIDLRKYATDGLDCFWSILSRYYPFDDQDATEYMRYINAKELERNMFKSISDDTLEMVKLYKELNT